jgi:hypothetical protein
MVILYLIRTVHDELRRKIWRNAEMAIGFHQQTAKIFQFPVKIATARAAEMAKAARICDAGSGGWYHEQAITESQQPRKS